MVSQLGTDNGTAASLIGICGLLCGSVARTVHKMLKISEFTV
jgi:hypothetical protein